MGNFRGQGALIGLTVGGQRRFAALLVSPLPAFPLLSSRFVGRGLAWLLPAYEAQLRVKERKHPKLYWADPGIARAARQEQHQPTASERGPLLEGWVCMLL